MCASPRCSCHSDTGVVARRDGSYWDLCVGGTERTIASNRYFDCGHYMINIITSSCISSYSTVMVTVHSPWPIPCTD